MLIEIHMIQNHAPSNLNRDDTGSPKDAMFGGHMRARISSQCIKRSIRRSSIFEESLQGHLGKRTRRFPLELKEGLLELGCTEAVADVIAKKATAFGSDKEGDEYETRQLIFLGTDEVRPLAEQMKKLWDVEGEKGFVKLKVGDLEGRLNTKLPRSVDIALFGRMTTSAAFDDVQASVQVAHAISTTRVERQFDYFTAVDDLVQASDETGAGMIGDVEFNSATYYKYFALDWDSLVANLGDDTDLARKTVAAFIAAAALATPTGKQNSFAAHNPPDAILIEVKDKKIPTSYANAFVDPVKPNGKMDAVKESICRLSDYACQLKKAYSLNPSASMYVTTTNAAIQGSDKMDSLDAMLRVLEEAIRQ